MRAKPRRDAIGLKLSTKVVIALYAVFAVFGVIDYAIQHQVILPSFQSLEEESARTDMERVTRTLDRELTQLMTFSADWGNWIDTYKFMEDQQPGLHREQHEPLVPELVGNRARGVSRSGRSLHLASGLRRQDS